MTRSGERGTDAVAAAESVLAELQAEGADAAGLVRVRLDGLGRLDDVELGAMAMSGSRGALELAIRDAFDAAFTALQQAREQHAEQLTAAGEADLGDVTDDLARLQAESTAQLQRVFAVVAETTARFPRRE